MNILRTPKTSVGYATWPVIVSKCLSWKETYKQRVCFKLLSCRTMTSHLLGHTWEHWHWDAGAKSASAQLSPCQQLVYFHTNALLESEGSAGIRGTKGEVTYAHLYVISMLKSWLAVVHGHTCSRRIESSNYSQFRLKESSPILLKIGYI